MNRLAIGILALGALAAAAVPAAELSPQGDEETLGSYLDRVAPLPAEAASPDEAAAAVAGEVASAALAQLAPAPGGTAGSSFAGRVNGTLQNFLPLFQGAIDAVSTSDDQKTVTVRFNPIRAGAFGELGLTAGASEPQPAEALLALLPDDTRPGQEEVIEKGLDDFSDLSFSASYNYVRRLEAQHLQAAPTRRWFFGRNPRLYEELFARYVGAALAEHLRQAEEQRAPLLDLLEEGVRAESLTGQQLRGALGNDYPRFLELSLADRRALPAVQEVASRSAELFADLVANQPQATLSAVYRDRDPLVGPNDTTVNLSIELPSEPNINALLRGWRRSQSWLDAVEDLESRKQEIRRGTKWSLVASYVERQRYDLSYQPTTDGAAAVNLRQPRSTQLSAKFQYTRNATWQPMSVNGTDVYPALHVAAERTDVSDDPTRQDRWVVTVTYDLPLATGTSVPISLVYANHSEFLGDPEHRLSAHFGLNLNALFQ